MPYPDPTAEQIAAFREHGWLAVHDAIEVSALDDLSGRCRRIVEQPTRYALDTSKVSRPEGVPPEHVLQSTLELVWIEWRQARFHTWARQFARALLGGPVEHWFNQVLFKPPHIGTETFWHQDDAYLGGTGQQDVMVSCWMPLHDVDEARGCMQFVQGGHRLGIVQALAEGGGDCVLDPYDVDGLPTVAAPLRAGGVTFHHGKTPHMALANTSDLWREAIIQRFVVPGVIGR